ncbi:MAG: Rne/Rng family ribonuclease, partial [Proteobacteria bacterium]|nr:Rne/Rng family ribonuclease [Pseudomonadota bacterium]
MYKKIVVNVCEHETRVALLEDGTISEFFIERGNISDIAGNIYKGKVQRVLPGMQAAFIDIGINQAAFIYVDDLNMGVFNELNPFNSGEVQIDDTENLYQEPTHFSKKNHDIKIGDLITEGQELLVQVAKPPIGTKGARVTSYATLPGRFLVLMPNSDHIGVSRRIENETERNRLKEMIISLRKENYGYIVRTAAEGIHEETLENEMSFLINLWRNIQEKNKKAAAPSLLHKELTVCLRAARDLLMHEADKMIIDSRPDYESVLSFLDTFMPSLKSAVELYEDYEPIFDAYNLEGDISRAIKRKIWLKSGGYIVIEHTEALVAIDVNTGRYVGKHNLEETILKTNLEAVKEIAYQVRLRDIGGIIIIDFIDMEKKQN